MALELDIIARHFQQPGLAGDPLKHRHIRLGIGDDCALLNVPRGKQLALSMDVLVEGVHFPADAPPALLAQRALAVNLSDLAAMGADPFCFTLGLTMPAADEAWLSGFSAGLKESAERYACPLVGGNLARGPLQVAIQVQGLLPKGDALLRSQARPGHDVWVSGETGRAGLALEWLQGKCPDISTEQEEELLAAYYRPEPRLALGQELRDVASAAQDVSDGLLIDLSRLAQQSRVKITVEIAAMPLAGILTSLRDSSDVFRLAMTAGDDYELVFTAASSKRRAVQAAARKAGVTVSRIGTVSAGEGVDVLDLSGRPLAFEAAGFEHFR
ncbi:MAG TPA: thiamine-phosphate kinase [Pseudomonadaceae bacterium]|nr:thiamine-phosphate kinase [Pseudomonadaceae bacterium]